MRRSWKPELPSRTKESAAGLAEETACEEDEDDPEILRATEHDATAAQDTTVAPATELASGTAQLNPAANPASWPAATPKTKM